MATLLLADDSVTIQRVIELTFANEGIRVVTVADGAAAIGQLQAARPDIILADVGLPQVDGYRLAEQVKRTPALAGVPVLLLTGAFEPVDEARARQSGCDGVLVKPFEPQRLVGTVKSLLAGRRPDHLWPADMPRIEGAAKAPSAPRQPSRAAYDGLDDQVGEPGPMPAPSAVEEVFESGLDDLDMAFSRLDPVAPPSRLDADTASDFQRDLQELRSTTPPPVETFAPPPGVSVGPAVSHLPIEEATPVDAADLEWDLPTPATVVEAIPLPASFPSEPEPTPAPVVVPDVVEVPAAEPIGVIEAEPSTPAAPPTPPTPPAPPEPAPPAPPAPPPSLSTAFAALLAAEQAQPDRLSSVAGPVVPEAEIEEVVRRVVTRMTEEVVHKMVHESAERLIREEMAKFKR